MNFSLNKKLTCILTTSLFGAASAIFFYRNYKTIANFISKQKFLKK